MLQHLQRVLYSQGYDPCPSGVTLPGRRILAVQSAERRLIIAVVDGPSAAAEILPLLSMMYAAGHAAADRAVAVAVVEDGAAEGGGFGEAAGKLGAAIALVEGHGKAAVIVVSGATAVDAALTPEAIHAALAHALPEDAAVVCEPGMPAGLHCSGDHAGMAVDQGTYYNPGALRLWYGACDEEAGVGVWLGCSVMPAGEGMHG